MSDKHILNMPDYMQNNVYVYVCNIEGQTECQIVCQIECRNIIYAN